MKINKAKLLVGTLAIVATAATVGSISGTVAWFQYSTRSTVALEGAAMHCSEHLEVRLHQAAAAAVGSPGDPGYKPAVVEHASAWMQDLETSAVTEFLENANVRDAAANTLVPVTTGSLALGEVADTFYKNPIYQYEDMTKWGTASAKTDYIELPLEFRVIDLDGTEAASQKYLEKNIYLSDLTIVAKTAGKDISKAVRVAVKNGTTYQQTFALGEDASTNQSVATHGNLDLNNDGDMDETAGYEWTTGRTTIDYGKEADPKTNVAVAQRVNEKATLVGDAKIADDTDPYNIKGKPLGQTVAGDASSEPAHFALTVRIYLEGWTKLPAANFKVTGNAEAANETVAVWDVAKVLEANFYVGMRFTAEAHTNH